MNDPREKDADPSGDIPNKEGQGEENDLTALRRLLFSPEMERLDRLDKSLNDPKILAEHLSRVLPEAIVRRGRRDTQLPTALQPAIERAVSISLKRDLKKYANLFFPVIGPAIRKAIVSTLRKMMQSLNTTLERSFSLQGLKWRFQAIRSGKPFAEIVLLNALVYRVEQVFLIHRETGLLLCHVVSEDVVIKDADMVSGMLTAIQDFVKDSFGGDENSALDSFHVGEFSVWIEQGPSMILAAVIRGSAPVHLKSELETALENIQLETGHLVENFDGDPSVFEPARPHLEACLRQGYKSAKRKSSPILWVLLALVLSVVGYFTYDLANRHYRMKSFLSRLNDVQGVVVTTVARDNGVHVIHGLRDPLSVHPSRILNDFGISTEIISFRFTHYYCLEPEIVLARAHKMLTPPDTITLSLLDGILSAEGAAPYSWASNSRWKAPSIPGIIDYDDSRVEFMEILRLQAPESVRLTIKDGVLIAQGVAPHQWITEARKRISGMDAITAMDDSALKNSDLVSFGKLAENIEQTILPFFDVRDVELGSRQKEALDTLAGKIKAIWKVSKILDRKIKIQIVGHADKTGPEAKNIEISRTRAENVRSYLISGSLPQNLLLAKGVGSSQPVGADLADTASAINRSVTFRVVE